MKEKKIIYYKDELNDEFSGAEITPRKIDENYKYIHKNVIWNATAVILQNILSLPIKYLYAHLKLKIKYVGKEKYKTYKKQGYFIYGNHTQVFADTFITSNGNYPKRNYFIVNPENGKVISCESVDVTENFVNGANESLKIAQMFNCDKALLKEGSPSCGCNLIYDGTFSGKKIPGKGVTAALFIENNIEVFSEKEL